MTVWIQNPFDNLPCEGHRKQRFWMMAEAFAAAGHSVVLWTSDFSHANKAPRTTPSHPANFDLRLVPTPPYRRNVGLARVRSHRAYARAWQHLARMESVAPGLIVASLPTLSGAAAALSLGRVFGARVVIDVQDAWPETFERLVPRACRGLARLALAPQRRLAQRIYREADLVTGVCERYRALTGRADYRSFRLGVELGPYGAVSDRRRSDAVRLVYSGNLGCTYDLKTVLRAVGSDPGLELDIAGFGAPAGIPCGLADRVRFHGYLSAADLQALFASCDIGVIPMADESWVGIPNKMFDYSAAGLRIVSSLGGECAALLERYRCGVTYRPGDAGSLAAAIRAAAALDRRAARQMCEREFDAARIYPEYVRTVLSDLEIA